LRMLGSSSGRLLHRKEHRPNPRITQITTDELLGGITKRRGRGLSLLGICLLAAMIGGPASLAGGAGPNAQVQRTRLAAFAAGSTSQTITFGQLPDTKVGQPVTLSASATSGLAVSFTPNTPAVCTVSGSAVTTMTAGVCVITASQGGSATYAAAPEEARSFQVTTGQAPQMVSFTLPPETAPPGVPVGQPVTLSASAAPGLDVSFSSDTPQVCTVSGATVLTVGTGTCTITASQGGSANYAPAPDVRDSFEVCNGKPQWIKFGPLPDTPARTQFRLTAKASSGLDVSYTASPRDVCTVTGSAATTVKAGTCTITATQAGDSTWAPATPAQQSFTVTKAEQAGDPARHKSQTITFIPPSQAKAGQLVTLSASASSGLPVSFASNTPAVCTAAGPTVTTMTAGACMITASQGGSADWAPARPVTQSFPVNLAGHKPQTITFDPPSQAQAGDPVTLSASSSSGLPVSFASDTPPVCTVSGSTVITMAAGACMITASQDGSADYAAAPSETRSFLVDPAPSNWTAPLVFLLAAGVMAAAGLTAAVRHLRLRSRRPPVHAPSVRAVPEPGPLGQVDVHNTGSAPTRTVRIESNPGASITTIEEARP
jgi:hypothetical protein